MPAEPQVPLLELYFVWHSPKITSKLPRKCQTSIFIFYQWLPHADTFCVTEISILHLNIRFHVNRASRVPRLLLDVHCAQFLSYHPYLASHFNTNSNIIVHLPLKLQTVAIKSMYFANIKIISSDCDKHDYTQIIKLVMFLYFISETSFK